MRTMRDSAGFSAESGYQARFPAVPEPPFHEAGELERVWGASWGSADEISLLRAVLMRRPGAELEEIRADAWDSSVGALVDPDGRWYWTSEDPPDLELVHAQYDGLAATLRAEGVEINFADPLPPRFTKAMFTRDPALSVPGGLIVGRLAPRMRRGEEASVLRKAAELGIPIVRTIAGTGLVEGGSFAKLTSNMAAFGTSIRCNAEGARQLEETLRPFGIELLVVALPGFSIHLDGHFAMVDVDKALVDPTALPHWFLDRLRELRIEPIFRHEDEAWSVNLLVVRPGRVIMDADSPYTAELLDRRGVEVIPIPYDEVEKNGGGVHCSILELRRDPP